MSGWSGPKKIRGSSSPSQPPHPSLHPSFPPSPLPTTTVHNSYYSQQSSKTPPPYPQRLCMRGRPSSSSCPLLFLFVGLVLLTPSLSASWAKKLADKAGALLDSTLQMGQAMSGGGKAFGEAAAQIVGKPVNSETCKADGKGQEVATFAAGCFWSGAYSASHPSIFFFFPCFGMHAGHPARKRSN